MLSKENFSKNHIEFLRKSGKVDPAILERSIYALGLLDVLAGVGLPFIFKGGTAVMLLSESPKKLSTDIDIVSTGWAYSARGERFSGISRKNQTFSFVSTKIHYIIIILC